MKVTVIPIVIRALGTVTKELIQRLGGGNNKDEWRQSKLLHY